MNKNIGNLNKLHFLTFLKEKEENLKFLENSSEFSIEFASSLKDRDKNVIIIYKDDNQIEFVERGDFLGESNILKLYNSFDFNFIENSYFKYLFSKIIDISVNYSFYKQHDLSKNFSIIDSLINNKKKSHSIDLKIPYDIVASLGPGRLSSINGELIIYKSYKINPDFTISEEFNVHLPTKSDKKIYFKILKYNQSLYKFFISKDDINYLETNECGLLNFVNERIFDRYQATIKKNLKINKAEYSEDYVNLLKMINI